MLRNLGALSFLTIGLLAGPAAAAEATDDTTALVAAADALDAALRNDDADALMAQVAPEVVMMPPGEAPVRGAEATRAWYEGLLAGYRTVAIEFTEREVRVDGDLGVVSGRHRWTLTAREGGDPFTEVGSYVQVWTRGADGRWLFLREIWNSSTPPPAP